MDVDATTRNWIIGGVIIIVLLVLGWWLFTKPGGASMFGSHAASTAAAKNATSTMATTTTVSTGVSTGVVTTALKDESIQVDDQAAGKSVTIATMHVTRSTWVAVRDFSHVLGARRFEPGVTAGTIPLLRATAAGQQYLIVMYVDNGDGVFDLHKDMLVTNGSGAPVGDMFVAQ